MTGTIPRSHTEIERRTLPHSRLRVPTGTVPRVTSLYGAATANGVAFHADVHFDQTKIGMIYNEGRGGDTDFMPCTPDARRIMSDFVSRCQLEDNPVRGSMCDEERVFNDLVDEFEADEEIEKAAEAGGLAVRGVDDKGYVGPYARIRQWPLPLVSRQAVSARLDQIASYTTPYTWYVWFKGAWHPIAPEVQAQP